ncbi:putative fatty acyl-CoA reductase CG5065 [Diachasmimorpha longicaudata]|uniref:putative fatty acyl-CoA reductase CG5065 n=1 Tax=Diachasmimorpha longicaudata TaxID=58733 RepID=UPI0030B8ED51
MQKYSINRSLCGSTVLLTGVTGFIGGSLLERILRLNPGPNCVYVLVRKREGLSPRARVDKILSSPLFAPLEPEILLKVKVIPCDLTAENLGLSDSDRDVLLSECSHVFHSAAFISFAANLSSAVRINLLSTRHLLELTKRMPKLRSMVHISTAYANCTRNSDEELQERLYPSTMEPASFIDMIEGMSSEEIVNRTNEILGDHLNTYTFTKQMAENLLALERENVPLSIVRPSIVLNSWRQPTVGWVDNVNNSACGFIAGIGKGLFRTFQATPNTLLDVIPVDMVVSTILAASERAQQEPQDLHIFHCTSNTINPTTWDEYCEEVVKACRAHPCENALWYPTARTRESHLRNILVIYIFQIFPAFIIDCIFRLSNPEKKHLVYQVQQKYLKGNSYTSFFSTHKWKFDRRNIQSLQDALVLDEGDAHPMDPRLINWSQYFEACVLGTRTYFHKEPAATTDRARRQMKRLKIIAELTPFLTFALFTYIMITAGVSWSVAVIFSAAVVLFFIWL